MGPNCYVAFYPAWLPGMPVRFSVWSQLTGRSLTLRVQSAGTPASACSTKHTVCLSTRAGLRGSISQAVEHLAAPLQICRSGKDTVAAYHHSHCYQCSAFDRLAARWTIDKNTSVLVRPTGNCIESERLAGAFSGNLFGQKLKQWSLNYKSSLLLELSISI